MNGALGSSILFEEKGLEKEMGESWWKLLYRFTR